ncbi:MAG: hypothetical protein FJW23_05230 [Acidimicrobiia bacterium]|nr:hypothetical protein [Acidimicrobiia bacterium]
MTTHGEVGTRTAGRARTARRGGARAVLVPAALVVAVLATAGAIAVLAQATSDLRADLRNHFDIVGLSSGVGLVPHDPSGGVRLVEVRDGVVSINGQPATAQEVRDRLGEQGDLVLRVTYLDADALAELTGGAAAGDAAVAARDDDGRSRAGTARRTTRGDLVRFGGGVTVEADQHVEGDVVAMGGSADVSGIVDGDLVVLGGSGDVTGTVDGDVVVVGGSLDLGSDAFVGGDVSVVGGTLNRAPGARIRGGVNDVGFGGGPPWHGHMPGSWAGWQRAWAVGSVIGTLIRGSLLLLAVLLVVAVGGRQVETIGARVAADPLRSGLIGLLAEVLFVPLLLLTTIVLAISIVGIPVLLLMPFAIVLALVVMLVGFSGAAYQVGQFLRQRAGITSDSPFAAAAIGVVAILALTIAGALIGLGGFMVGGVLGWTIGSVGFLLEYLAWTIGLGAALMTWRNVRNHHARVPPAAPPLEPPPEGAIA